MAQQTAVEWLVFEVLGENARMLYGDLIRQAKAMEKEQIKKAFADGQEMPINHPTLPHFSNEEYYNETYNK
jgi:hypothetical protein